MEMMQAKENKGYDLSKAIPFYFEGLNVLEQVDIKELRVIITSLLEVAIKRLK